MNRWLLLLIPLALATCQRPTEFEATNRNDPESPNLQSEAPPFFNVSVGSNNSFGLSWRSGRFDGARIQVDMVIENVYIRVYDDFAPGNSITIPGRPAHSLPFRFSVRYVLGDTVGPWSWSKMHRYVLPGITSPIVSGQPTGIRFSWTQASVNTYQAFNLSSDVIGIRVPNSEWTVLKSADDGPFEPIAITTTKTYLDEFFPEAGVRYRYKVRTRADSLTLESTVTTALRQVVQTQTVVGATLPSSELQEVDSTNDRILMVSTSSNTLAAFNLASMQTLFSVSLNQAVSFAPFLTYAEPRAAFGAENDVYVAYRHQVHSYNSATQSKRVVAALDPKYVIEAIYYDPSTHKLVIRAFYFQSTGVDQSETMRAAFVLDLSTDQVIQIYGDMLSHLLFFEEISTLDSSVMVHFPLRSTLEITSLETMSVESFASSGNYWMGPIFESPEDGETAIFMVHNFDGLVVQQKGQRSARKLAEFGKIQWIRYDDTMKRLYLWNTATTLVVDVAQEFRVITTHPGQFVQPEAFFWNGRLFLIRATDRKLVETVVSNVWLSGS